ncbi:MAG: signal recognition particle-docking protein FtsY [Candidatus Altiarchaeota archaeon]|nr:signal recognition particle-docking protein FtsY [Candidatus Altiarchaeota archaeon]
MFGFLKKKIKEVLKLPKKDRAKELELVLLEAGISFDVVDELINNIKESDDQKKSLRQSILDLLVPGKFEIKTKPYVILFIGINGVGKTTNLAKVAHLLKKQRKKIVVAGSDTFRAAAIEQLGEHCKKLKIPLIKQPYGADPAAVAYDAISHAKAKKLDIVLIDTSGRLHVDAGLMKELEKIKKVANPDLTLLVVDATTGNDAVEQALAFDYLADGFIVSKADVDERGGAIISISFIAEKPIYFLGTGQKYQDLEEFSPEKIIKELDL